MLPGDGLFGAERGFGDPRVRRAAGDSGQIQLVAAGCIGGAEERADIVQAAHVVEQDGNRDRAQALDKAPRLALPDRERDR